MKRLRNCILIILCVTFLVSAVSALFSELLTVKADTHNYDIDYKTKPPSVNLLGGFY